MERNGLKGKDETRYLQQSRGGRHTDSASHVNMPGCVRLARIASVKVVEICTWRRCRRIIAASPLTPGLRTGDHPAPFGNTGHRASHSLTPHPARNVLFLGTDGIGVDGRGGELGVAQPFLP